MILCAGEALIDMLPRRTVEGEFAFAPHTGGAVFNTAIALGRLKRNVQFFSGLSTDFFGDMLIDQLSGADVDTSLITRKDAPTTLAMVRLKDGHAHYDFYDENTAGRRVTAPQTITAKAGFFGGISLAVDPCADVYDALHSEMSRSAVTMIDPNIRPSFIGDEAAYRARMFNMMERSDIIKLSDEDALWLFKSCSMDTWAQHLISKGAALVCITQGADGVQAYSKDHALHIPAHPASVVDTVGAGDTFNAGLLCGLDEQNLLQKDSIATLTAQHIKIAVDLGARAAAVTVSRAGANPPLRSEL